MRLLFSSIHCYLDPSSGAALCTHELLELLAARGADCRVLTTGILDPERETSLDEVLATLELPTQRLQAELGPGGSAEVIDLGVNGVPVTLMPTVSSRAERSPDPRESAIFLELADQVFDRFRPDVLLTYGGHSASLELMRRARQQRFRSTGNSSCFTGRLAGTSLPGKSSMAGVPKSLSSLLATCAGSSPAWKDSLPETSSTCGHSPRPGPKRQLCKRRLHKSPGTTT